MQSMDNNGAGIHDVWRRKKDMSEALSCTAIEIWKQWKLCTILSDYCAYTGLK
ncbi:hypothetical protein [Thermoanaerobacterium thermosaccharolyticum]|jgi:hypothetical protein|uniref:hypothetical protein n=1 Tax=Thermoanaerobacterium thermosaccharolyticum TaxID=1517 RepID=UPI003DA7E7A7